MKLQVAVWLIGLLSIQMMTACRPMTGRPIERLFERLFTPKNASKINAGCVSFKKSGVGTQSTKVSNLEDIRVGKLNKTFQEDRGIKIKNGLSVSVVETHAAATSVEKLIENQTFNNVSAILANERKVISLLPTNSAEEMAVFGIITKKEFNSERPSIKNVKDQITLYNEILSSKENSYCIIIGHNEFGVIKLPNGHSIGISKIDAMCIKQNVVPIYITCNSGNYTSSLGTDYLVTEFYAIDVAERLILEIQKGATRQELDALIKFYGNASDVNDYVYIIKRGSIPGGALFCYYISSQKKLRSGKT